MSNIFISSTLSSFVGNSVTLTILSIQEDSVPHISVGKVIWRQRLNKAIYEECEKKKDVQSEQIRVKMAGILTDFHAADMIYYGRCCYTFACSRHDISYRLMAGVLTDLHAADVRLCWGGPTL